MLSLPLGRRSRSRFRGGGENEGDRGRRREATGDVREADRVGERRGGDLRLAGGGERELRISREPERRRGGGERRWGGERNRWVGGGEREPLALLEFPERDRRRGGGGEREERRRGGCIVKGQLGAVYQKELCLHPRHCHRLCGPTLHLYLCLRLHLRDRHQSHHHALFPALGPVP